MRLVGKHRKFERFPSLAAPLPGVRIHLRGALHKKSWADIESENELTNVECGVFPSSQRRGGCGSH